MYKIPLFWHPFIICMLLPGMKPILSVKTDLLHLQIFDDMCRFLAIEKKI